MKRTTQALAWVSLIVVACSTLRAQDDSNDFEKINTNLGMTVTAPLNPTARFVNVGWGLTAGVGYTFTKRHAVIGEFMWNSLRLPNAPLEPLRAAATPQAGDIRATGDLYSLTGNYRFELRGKVFGTYFIGGGGWYYRSVSLSREVTLAPGTTCTSALVWWGFDCVSGTVTTVQTRRSSASSALGANAGIGFTIKVGEPSYRVYFEGRYHYAPNKNINSQFITTTVGLRY